MVPHRVHKLKIKVFKMFGELIVDEDFCVEFLYIARFRVYCTLVTFKITRCTVHAMQGFMCNNIQDTCDIIDPKHKLFL